MPLEKKKEKRKATFIQAKEERSQKKLKKENETR